METNKEYNERIENISYIELINALQGFFDVEQETVESLLRSMYRGDLKGERHMRTGRWTFVPFENQEDQRAFIIKSTGYKYLIGTQDIKKLNKQTGELESQTILKIYKRWKP